MRVMIFGTIEMEWKHAEKVRTVKDLYTQHTKNTLNDIYKKQCGQTLNQQELACKTFLLFGMMNWTFGWYSSEKSGSCLELIDDIFSTFVCGFGNPCTIEIDKKHISDCYSKYKISEIWQEIFMEKEALV